MSINPFKKSEGPVFGEKNARNDHHSQFVSALVACNAMENISSVIYNNNNNNTNNKSKYLRIDPGKHLRCENGRFESIDRRSPWWENGSEGGKERSEPENGFRDSLGAPAATAVRRRQRRWTSCTAPGTHQPSSNSFSQFLLSSQRVSQRE